MSSAHPPVWRRLLDGWAAIAGRFGGVQTRVLLAFLYVLLIGPAALVLGNQILRKEDQPELHEDFDWRERYELD
jgi:hypothetical protein